MTRPDPRQFGRKPEPITQEQAVARVIAFGALAWFPIILGFALGLQNISEGARCVLVMVAYCALILGVAAAGEA